MARFRHHPIDQHIIHMRKCFVCLLWSRSIIENFNPNKNPAISFMTSQCDSLKARQIKPLNTILFIVITSSYLIWHYHALVVLVT